MRSFAAPHYYINCASSIDKTHRNVNNYLQNKQKTAEFRALANLPLAFSAVFYIKFTTFCYYLCLPRRRLYTLFLLGLLA